MSEHNEGFWATWVMFSPWFYGTMALGMSIICGIVALVMMFWPAGVMSLLLLGAGVWNLSTGLRIWRARREGASPVSVLIGGTSRGAGFAVNATQSNETHTQQGMVVIVGNLAAFIPLGDWEGRVGSTLTMVSSLHVSKVAMLPIPQSANELRALMMANMGFILDQSWVWAIPGTMLTSPDAALMVSMGKKLRKPYINLWQVSDRTQEVAGKVFKAIAAIVVAILTISVAAWWHTGNIELLQAAFCYTLMFAIIGGVVAFNLRMLR